MIMFIGSEVELTYVLSCLSKHYLVPLLSPNLVSVLYTPRFIIPRLLEIDFMCITIGMRQ